MSLGWTRSETRRSEEPLKWERFQRRSKNAGCDEEYVGKRAMGIEVQGNRR